MGAPRWFRRGSLAAAVLVAASAGGVTSTVPDDPAPWIVYAWGAPCAMEGPGPGLCLVHEDGSEAHAILLGDGEVNDPDWSPDGQSIAYVLSSAPGQLWIVGLDGSYPRPVIDDPDRCPAEARSPAWSPDGTRLAFMCLHADGATTEIAVVDVVSGTVDEVITAVHPDEGFEEVWDPRWSPDGQHLVFERDYYDAAEATTGQELVVIDISGDDATAITPVSMFASHPDWSPDGELIVFSTYGISGFQTGAPGAVNLYTVHPDGSQITPVTAYPTGGDRAGQPSFTPDGTRIIFTLINGYDFGGFGQRRAAFIDVAGSDVEPVDGVWATHPRLQP